MDPFLGEIRLFGFNFDPANWALCNGQLLPISQNTALFALLGVNFGGDGRSTFGLPNLNGSAPLGAGAGPGLTPRSVGDTGGALTETLVAAHLPSHSHAARAQASNSAPAYSPVQNVWSSDSGGSNAYAPASAAQVPMAPDALAHAGAGHPHNNLQPYLVLNFCIALQGDFPART